MTIKAKKLFPVYVLLLAFGLANSAHSALSDATQANLLNNKIKTAIKAEDYPSADQLFREYDTLKAEIPTPLILQRARVYFHLKQYSASLQTLEYYLNKVEEGSESYEKALKMYQDIESLAEPEIKATAEVEPIVQRMKSSGIIDGMIFKRIPAGSFRMGDSSGESDEVPPHTVRISAFEMSAYEVTVGQFAIFVADSGYVGEWDWEESDLGGDGYHPVVNVSYDDAQAYIRWLNEKTGGNYRLPTEAEWEYAARAGTTTQYSWGDSASQAVAAYAWYDYNAGGSTHAVGGKQPNPWGLYDIHGNVWEWVSDWYDEDYYKNSPNSDPQGPSSGGSRVVRGGGWSSSATNLRSADRGYNSPSYGYSNLGFRLVRTP